MAAHSTERARPQFHSVETRLARATADSLGDHLELQPARPAERVAQERLVPLVDRPVHAQVGRPARRAPGPLDVYFGHARGGRGGRPELRTVAAHDHTPAPRGVLVILV